MSNIVYMPPRDGSRVSIAAVRRAALASVQEHGPSHRGAQGHYFNLSGKSGCLVGDMLHRLGVHTEPIRKTQLNFTNIEGLAAAIHLNVDTRTLVYLCELQAGNDCGKTWGQALEEADQEDLHFLTYSAWDLVLAEKTMQDAKRKAKLDAQVQVVETYANGGWVNTVTVKILSVFHKKGDRERELAKVG